MIRLLLTLISLCAISHMHAQMSVTTVPPLNGGNGSSGITFNVETRNADIVIDSIYNSFYGSFSTSATIWYKPAPINGSPTISSANGWIQLGTTTLTPLGTSTSPVVPQLVDVPIGITIPAGLTYGFHIGGNSVAYTTHNTANQDTFQNSDIAIYTGPNVGYGGPAPNPPNHPRQFNGTVFYSPLIKAANDAGVASIDSPSAFCPGVHTVKATIKNYGINVINGVTVNWTLNGIPMSPVNFNGTLDTINGSGNNTAQVTLGQQNFIMGPTYTVRAWTDNPNGVADTNNRNDTTDVPLKSAISGTFTIGGTSPDYATISDAAQALNQGGVCGPTEFLIRPGTYNERVVLNHIAGASAINTITFKSTTTDSTDVVLTYNATSSAENEVLLLDGADFVSFEYLTIRATGTSWGTAVRFGSGGVSEGNSIIHCLIEGGNGQTTSSNQAAIVASGGTQEHTTIRQNFITNCAYGLYWQSSGGEGNRVLDNVIHSYYTGLRMDGQTSVEIKGNDIRSNTQGIYNFYYGIYLSGGGGTPLIEANQVHVETGAYGMYLSSINADAQNPGLVANNMVHVGGTGTGYGIYTSGSTSNLRLFFNTVSITNTSGTGGRAWMNASSGSGLRVMNNIFSNHGGGVAVYMTSSNTGSVDTADYNCYYTIGSALGFWGTSVFDIPSLQAQSGMDGNSVSIDPGFFSTSQNLHATSAILNDMGFYLPAVPMDIDGDPRSLTTPDIGADEFEPLQNDLGILFFENPTRFGCNISSTTPVTVAIVNYGTDPQSNFDVTLQIFNVIVANETVSGPVLSGDTLFYTFSTPVDLSVPAIYPMKAWTIHPLDQNSFNDSLLFHPVFSENYVRNFPYVMDFETSMNGLPLSWINDPFDGEQDWNFSTTSPGTLPEPMGVPGDHTTGTGHFAWIDNTSPNEPVTNLYSPCLDLTNLSNPFLEFYLWNADVNNSVRLHIDVWSNGEWHLDVVPSLGYQSSVDWVYHLIPLQQFGGTDAKVRFRAEETGLNSNFDLALDDIKIFNLGPVNTGVIDEIQPVTDCGLSDIEEVEVWIVQFGFDTLRVGDTIGVGFSVDGSPPLTENLVLTSDLAQFDSIKYKFNSVADLSQPGDHTVKIWTRHPQDDDFTNDTLTVTVSNVLISAFPYTQDFETFVPSQNATGFDDYWYTEPSNTSVDFRWNVHQGSTPSGNTGPTGDFDQGGEGTYLYTESSSGTQGDEATLLTPCIDLSGLSNPGFNFAYHMFGAAMGSLHIDVQVNGVWIDNVRPPFSGDQGNAWHEVAVRLQAFTGQTVVLRFRGVRGTSLTSDMAMDAFKFGELPNVALPDTIRSCGSVKLDAGPDGASYQWSTGQSTRVITVAGDPVNQVVQPVEVQVTSAGGLKNWASTVVILEPGPVLDLGPDTLVCGADSLMLDAGNPGMWHLWNDNTTQPQQIARTDGIYAVAVDNGQGCVKEDSVLVEFGELPVATFSSQRSGNQFEVSFENESDHGDSYLWDFGDGVFSTSTEPKHFYQDEGIFTVKLIAYNECGADTLVQSVSTYPIGIEQMEQVQHLQIAPNPTSGSVTLTISLDRGLSGGVHLYNLSGQHIIQKEVRLTPGTHTMVLDLSDQPEGVYWLVIRDDEGSITRPVVKQ